MKIAFDVSQTCQERAGCGWLADSLARALAEEFQRTGDQLLLYHQFGNWINSDTKRGTMIDNGEVEASFHGMSVRGAKKIWKDITEDGKAPPGKPDILHSNNFCAPRISSAKLVYMVHDLAFWFHPEFATEANRLHCQDGILKAMCNADAFLFNSEHTRAEFETTFPRWLAANQKPACVIPLGARGANQQLFSDERTHWLSVGSLEPRKNHNAILDAMEIYWNRSIQKRPLLIAGGSGWKSENTKFRIQHMEMEGKVSYLGYVEDGKLRRLYQGAIGFIFPSWHEGFGLPVLEAMCNGCPVISSNRASLPEVGGDAPIYVDPSQSGQIAEAMLRLESQPELVCDLSRRGTKQAEKFTWEKAAKATLEFYNIVITK